MPNQTMCRPSRRANKQATRVSRQSQDMRRSEEREQSRAEQSRGNWREMKIKPNVRRSSDGSNNAAVWGQGAGGRSAFGQRCVAVKHTQSVPAKRRARRARRARCAQTGRERR
jgi:hypothetical protein